MTAIHQDKSDLNIKIINTFYSGLNQNKIDEMLILFAPNIIRKEFEGTPNAGAFLGIKELRKNLANRDSWAEGSCNPIEFFSKDHKTVVWVHVKVRLKNEANWIDAHVADGFSINDGIITEFHSFIEKQKAFTWAGI